MLFHLVLFDLFKISTFILKKTTSVNKLKYKYFHSTNLPHSEMVCPECLTANGK